VNPAAFPVSEPAKPPRARSQKSRGSAKVPDAVTRVTALRDLLATATTQAEREALQAALRALGAEDDERP
jgi:hypothetical protein